MYTTHSHNMHNIYEPVAAMVTYMMLSDEQLIFHGRASVRLSHMLYHPDTFGQSGLGTSVLFSLPHSWFPSMPGTEGNGP